MTDVLVEPHIRKLQREDKEHIRTLLISTDAFKPKEIEVAMELVDIVLERPDQRDYEMYAYVGDARGVTGYICIGPTPMTNGTFDVYWFAVTPSAQRQGIGRHLLEFGEELVRSKAGRLIVVESSSQPKYLKARTFYVHNGYAEVAHIKDYYDMGDDLVIYAKYLRQ